MAAFQELDWMRFDVRAIAGYPCNGLAVVDDRRREKCLEWLRQHGYAVVSWDLRPGLPVAVPEIGRMLCWEEQFGYALRPDSRNLDGLRDGFEFSVPDEGRLVLELLGADTAWVEDPRWVLGLLEIAQEKSLHQLALGRRFFTLLILPSGSPLIGQPIGSAAVPVPYHNSNKDTHEFNQ